MEARIEAQTLPTFRNQSRSARPVARPADPVAKTDILVRQVSGPVPVCASDLVYEHVELTNSVNGAEDHWSPPRCRSNRKKFKHQQPGCCGNVNESFNGCCDTAEISKAYRKNIKPPAICACLNCAGCCDREKIWIRRGSSVDSQQLRDLEIHTKSSRKRRIGCGA